MLTISRSSTQPLMTADRTQKQDHPVQLLIYNARLEEHMLLKMFSWRLILSNSSQTPNSGIHTTTSLLKGRGTSRSGSNGKVSELGPRKIQTSIVNSISINSIRSQKKPQILSLVERIMYIWTTIKCCFDIF